MEKKKFHVLLNNYSSLSEEEAQLLISIEKEFPYSQVIHSLAARAAQDNNLAEKEEQLHLGAIYTTDRSVFKSIMTVTSQKRRHEVAENIQPELQRHEEIKAEVSNQVTTSPEMVTPPFYLNPEHTTDDSFYDEIFHDLDKLKELKNRFEETVKQFESGTLSSVIEADKNQKINIDPIDSTDELLIEIKSTKKKITPEDPKQKEQIEIIEKFIKTQPSIKGKVSTEEKSAPKDDLSEKSLTYSENIISETLAQILIKQGKKEKAIEVLKKLIWKFPQKKAYFAAQIEDLKK